MQEKLKQIQDQTLEALSNAKESEIIERIRVKVLGKKGELTELLRGMGALSAQERPKAGAQINALRDTIEAAIDERIKALGALEMERKLKREAVDVSAPGKRGMVGKLHPLTQTYNEICDIFLGMGFEIKEGPEVEYDRYAFEMLNIPKNHPARDAQDTFYITENIVLRPHTSPMQVRTMISEKPPIRILSPGRVFRADNFDATHSPVFHQIEGLVVDKGISMGDLKGTLDIFAKALYGAKTRTRFRPSFFPFTEPSAEMDVSCGVCDGEGCRVCKGSGWIEILGSGMVHPRVLSMCGIDPEEYSGFAFGMGLDRITNMKYGITDIRLHFENDLRFLAQF